MLLISISELAVKHYYQEDETLPSKQYKDVLQISQVHSV